MRVVIRADASAAMGGGHVMRCRSLAEALVARGGTAAFAVRGDCLDVARQLAGGLDILPLTGAIRSEPQDLMDLLPQGCDVLLVDHYGRDAEFERACRGWARRIVVIDDFPGRPHDCDVLVDQTAGRQSEAYRHYVPAGAQIYAGAMYAFLRRQFACARWHLACDAALREIRSDRPIAVLLAMGATDPGNATTTALLALEDLDRELTVDVVLAGGAPHLDTVRAAVAASRHDARLHVDAADIADLMLHADFAVGAAGSGAWERCCLGLPTVVVQTADNQRDIAAGLVGAGAAIVAGSDKVSIAAAVRNLIADPPQLGHMRRAALAMCDGLGAERLAVLLGPPVTARDGRVVTLRPADDADAPALLAWQRDPDTRRHARATQVPTEAEHLAWFQARRADPGCILNMINHGATRAGIVRLDYRRDKGGFEVSIVIAPERRGMGIARAALDLVRALLPEEHLLAYIKQANEASRKLFGASGYRSLGEDWYENRPPGDARGT